MPFGHNLFTCSKCGKPFIWGGCIDFVCPDCTHKKYLELCPDWRFKEDLEKEEASYYIKNYETSWGAC